MRYGDRTYAYTANGGLASKTQDGQTVAYDYDELGNLRSVALADGIHIEYLIDGTNRRVGKRVNGVQVQGFLYKDQLEPVAELNGTGQVVSVFVYGSRPHVPDYMIKAGRTWRIVSDHLGSPRLVIDTGTGEVVQQMDYDEFGRVILDTNPRFQPFGFAGGIYDPHTGLVRFGARDYDPEVGRWTAKDPRLFSEDGPNLYLYSAGDPVNLLDTDGRSPVLAAPVVAGGLITLTVGVLVYEWWIHTPSGEEWRKDISKRLPPFTIPIENRRHPQAQRPGAPGRTCPPPTAIPGAKARPKDLPPLIPADPADNEPPDIEKGHREREDFWDKVLDVVKEGLDWLG